MYEELNRSLIEIREKVRERDRLKILLDESEKSLESESEKYVQYEKILKKELADVEKLENSSLTGLFYSILGSKEDQLEKERQEYLAAKLKFDRCSHTVDSLKKEIARLKSQLSELDGIETELKNVITEKENLIAGEGGLHLKKLTENAEKTADAESLAKELAEAVSAGKDVLAEAGNVVKSLKSAKGWGTFDLLGGGIIATAVKHSKMDKAKESANRIQELLLRFNRELKDVDVHGAGMTVDVSSFLTFADYFFDNLITDWIVQSRIKNSLDSALDLNQRVTDIVSSLEKQLKTVGGEIKNLSDEHKKIIIEAG
ncbi:MAG: hypothetical protein GY863_24705 [bacterium]|nr:hypothetical protein [bacterium]